jgi:predicted CXXCH cytochrome family protein
MNDIQKVFLIATLSLLPATASAVQKPPSRDIVQTPHNLSITGGGGKHDIRSLTESRICIFCHTPHHASGVTPLWSREISTLTTYTPYDSVTLKASTKPSAVPRGASRLCLSCHDGTIALGLLAWGYNLDPALQSFNQLPQEMDPTMNPNLGTDLSNDHPISFPYSYPQNSELREPSAAVANGVKLVDGTYVECTSCHDPHNNQYGNFLLVDSRTQHDAICTACHNVAGWSDPDNAHRTGGGQYAGGWTYTAADGCLNCHIPHNAQPGAHLLRLAAQIIPPLLWPQQVAVNLSPGAALNLAQPGAAGKGPRGGPNESICFSSCHRQYPYKDIWSEFNNMAYTHPVKDAGRLHRKHEALPLSPAVKHVDCNDCHNPHQSAATKDKSGPSPTPKSSFTRIKGALRGVRGVEQTGSAALQMSNSEFEVCFRCHSGRYADKFVSLSNQRPARQFPAFDESLRFAQANPSFHPVLTDRRGNGRSLLSQLQPNMIRIDCTDCHAPHGSNEPHMLRAENLDSFPSSVSTYPLCFRCHDPDFLMNPSTVPHSSSVTLHRSHVLDHVNKAPCSACHDPHGSSLADGATAISGAHLVNFDTRYAGPAPVYNSASRSCTVKCHTNPIAPRSFLWR